MSQTEKLNILKEIMGVEESDLVLLTFLRIAGEKILRKAYPFHSDIREIPSEYDMLQVEIAVYLLNKRGAEGQTSHDENGIKRVYGSADVPRTMLTQVIPRCGV